MILVQTRELDAAFRADSDFVFLRIRLKEGADARQVLEAWHHRARASWRDRAWIGAPVTLGARTWVIDTEGITSRATLTEIVQDLASALEGAGLHGEIGREKPRPSPLDNPLARFALTAVAGSLPLGASAQEAAARRGWFSREDVEPQALAAAVAHAVRWCSAIGGAMHLAVDVLSVEATGRNLMPLMNAALRGPKRALHLTGSRWPQVARRVTFTREGHVLYHFGGAEAHEEPLEVAQQAEELMREVFSWVDYAFTLRTFEAQVSYVQILRTSWPELPGIPAHYLSVVRGLEGSRIPDAFGLQLLGPAHPIPSGPLGEYVLSEAGAGRTLVKSRRLKDWFEGTVPPPRDVIERGRADLSGLLLRQGDLDVQRQYLRGE